MTHLRNDFHLLLLLLAVVLWGCGDSSDTAYTTDDPGQSAYGTWTLHVTPADGSTRALTLTNDYKTLTESWAAGEKVFVYQQTGTKDPTMNLVGTLTAKTSGGTTTLSGSVTGTFSNGGELWLYTQELSPTFYDGQDGTLATLAAKYDLLYDKITIQTIDAGKHTLTTTQPIFQALRSICRFTLEDTGRNPLNATKLKVSADNSLVKGYDNNWEAIHDTPVTLTATLDGTTNVVFLSMADFLSGDTGRTPPTYTFTATVGSVTYTCKKSARLEFGQYYATTLTMTKQ
jgi:hypothetical protein